MCVRIERHLDVLLGRFFVEFAHEHSGPCICVSWPQLGSSERGASGDVLTAGLSIQIGVLCCVGHDAGGVGLATAHQSAGEAGHCATGLLPCR